MRYILSLLLIITFLDSFGQGNKVYHEAGSDEDLKKEKSSIENQKNDLKAVNLDANAAKEAAREFFELRDEAWKTKDASKIDLAYTKLREARELMGRAHTKWVAYHKQKGYEIVKGWEAEYTDAIRSYDQWLEPKNIDDDKAICKPITELYLVRPDNKVDTDNIDPENNDEDFWVVGDLTENQGCKFVRINNRKVNLKNYTLRFYTITNARSIGYGTNSRTGKRNELLNYSVLNFYGFFPKDITDNEVRDYYVRLVGANANRNWQSYEDYLNEYSDYIALGFDSYTSEAEFKENVVKIISKADFDFAMGKKELSSARKIADYEWQTNYIQNEDRDDVFEKAKSIIPDLESNDEKIQEEYQQILNFFQCKEGVNISKAIKASYPNIYRNNSSITPEAIAWKFLFNIYTFEYGTDD